MSSERIIPITFGYETNSAQIKSSVSQEICKIEGEMNDFFRNLDKLDADKKANWIKELKSPLIEQSENIKILKLRYNVRSYDPTEVSVIQRGNILIVEARHEENENRKHILRQYKKSIALPEGIHKEEVMAETSKDGVLIVSIPIHDEQIVHQDSLTRTNGITNREPSRENLEHRRLSVEDIRDVRLRGSLSLSQSREDVDTSAKPSDMSLISKEYLENPVIRSQSREDNHRTPESRSRSRSQEKISTNPNVLRLSREDNHEDHDRSPVIRRRSQEKISANPNGLSLNREDHLGSPAIRSHSREDTHSNSEIRRRSQEEIIANPNVLHLSREDNSEDNDRSPITRRRSREEISANLDDMRFRRESYLENPVIRSHSHEDNHGNLESRGRSLSREKRRANPDDQYHSGKYYSDNQEVRNQSREDLRDTQIIRIGRNREDSSRNSDSIDHPGKGHKDTRAIPVKGSPGRYGYPRYRVNRGQSQEEIFENQTDLRPSHEDDLKKPETRSQSSEDLNGIPISRDRSTENSLNNLETRNRSREEIREKVEGPSIQNSDENLTTKDQNAERRRQPRVTFRESLNTTHEIDNGEIPACTLQSFMGHFTSKESIRKRKGWISKSGKKDVKRRENISDFEGIPD